MWASQANGAVQTGRGGGLHPRPALQAGAGYDREDDQAEPERGGDLRRQSARAVHGREQQRRRDREPLLARGRGGLQR